MIIRIQGGSDGGASLLGFRGGFTFSALLHGLLIALALLPISHRTTWGDTGTGGGSAVPVNLAAGIPLPTYQAPPNPLATDTRTVHPPEVQQQAKEIPLPQRPSAKALEIEERREKQRLAELEKQNLRREMAQLRETVPNAVPGEGSRASSEMFGRFPTGQGSGGIGFGGGFGALYGWYVRAVRECISRHWDRGHIDPSIRNAPRVYLDFDILRDGTINGERLSTSSGYPAVDREALRAVQACSGRSDVGADAHLPALPADYSGARVKVEVWFEFRQ